MLSSSDLKKFFDEDRSFEQDGKRIYLVPLKEFMNSEEFSELPVVTYINEDENKTECHFLNSVVWGNIHPHLIVGKTKSEKTVYFVGLYERAIGSFPNVEYEFYVRLNADGTLNRDFVYRVKTARKKVHGKFIDSGLYINGCVQYYPNTEPCCYYDPGF